MEATPVLPPVVYLYNDNNLFLFFQTPWLLLWKLGKATILENTSFFIHSLIKSAISYEVDKFGNVIGQVSPGVGGEGDVSDDGYEGTYPEADTQPTEPVQFLYEVISEEDKTIAITGMKTEYEIIVPYEIDGYSVIELKLSTGSPTYLDSVQNVELPKGLKVLRASAFNGMASLQSISIPNTVTTINEGAFSGCRNLTSITIPDSVITMENGAFSGCNSLTSITIPDSITIIPNSAFSGCSSLANIIIPSSVTAIGNSAFEYCTTLTNITIPNSITIID